MSKSFSELRARAIACGVTSAYNVRGCSNEQIEEIERQAGVPLPKAYKEFLFVMGRGAGRLMSDVDVYYDGMLELNKRAAWILDNWEEGKLQLPADAFVFSMRQGEQFMFFHTNTGVADPPIYYYMEGAGRFEKKFDSLPDFIEDELSIFERRQ